jgi:hypothetical protein
LDTLKILPRYYQAVKCDVKQLRRLRREKECGILKRETGERKGMSNIEEGDWREETSEEYGRGRLARGNK